MSIYRSDVIREPSMERWYEESVQERHPTLGNSAARCDSAYRCSPSYISPKSNYRSTSCCTMTDEAPKINVTIEASPSKYEKPPCGTAVMNIRIEASPHKCSGSRSHGSVGQHNRVLGESVGSDNQGMGPFSFLSPSGIDADYWRSTQQRDRDIPGSRSYLSTTTDFSPRKPASSFSGSTFGISNQEKMGGHDPLGTHYKYYQTSTDDRNTAAHSGPFLESNREQLGKNYRPTGLECGYKSSTSTPSKVKQPFSTYSTNNYFATQYGPSTRTTYRSPIEEIHRPESSESSASKASAFKYQADPTVTQNTRHENKYKSAPAFDASEFKKMPYYDKITHSFPEEKSRFMASTLQSCKPEQQAKMVYTSQPKSKEASVHRSMPSPMSKVTPKQPHISSYTKAIPGQQQERYTSTYTPYTDTTHRVANAMGAESGSSKDKATQKLEEELKTARREIEEQCKQREQMRKNNEARLRELARVHEATVSSYKNQVSKQEQNVFSNQSDLISALQEEVDRLRAEVSDQSRQYDLMMQEQDLQRKELFHTLEHAHHLLEDQLRQQHNVALLDQQETLLSDFHRLLNELLDLHEREMAAHKKAISDEVKTMREERDSIISETKEVVTETCITEIEHVLNDQGKDISSVLNKLGARIDNLGTQIKKEKAVHEKLIQDSVFQSQQDFSKDLYGVLEKDLLDAQNDLMKKLQDQINSNSCDSEQNMNRIYQLCEDKLRTMYDTTVKDALDEATKYFDTILIESRLAHTKCVDAVDLLLRSALEQLSLILECEGTAKEFQREQYDMYMSKFQQMKNNSFVVS